MDPHFSGTLGRFLMDRSLVRVIVGPIGSGKTFACCMELMRRAEEQEPHPRDNIRYFRALVVRNTYRQLEDTSFATWDRIFRATGDAGFSKSRFEHVIKRPARPGVPGLHFQVWFRALDTFDDINNLLSNEPTMIYLNEVRELPRDVLVASKERVGRYPAVDQAVDFMGATFHGVIADANPPHHKHWLYQLMDERPAEHAFFIQPPAVLEVKKRRFKLRSGGEAVRWASIEPDVPFVYGPHLEPIEAAGRHWALNPYADNAHNLKWSYYHEKLPGSDLSRIQAYYQGRRVFTADGAPVIPRFQQDHHVDPTLEPMPNEPLGIGVDIGSGTLQPAAVIYQRDRMTGSWLIHDELYMPETAIQEFSQTLRGYLRQRYPDRPVGTLWLDPASKGRGGETGKAYIAHFREMGFDARQAPTNDIKPRVDAISAPMDDMVTIDGRKRPKFRIHPRCEHLVMGLAGGWSYRQIKTAGEMYSQTPTKNEFSHVCDALGYAMLGGGGWRELRRPERAAPRKRGAGCVKIGIRPYG